MPSMRCDCYGIVTTDSLLLESEGALRQQKALPVRDLEGSEEGGKKKGQPGEELPFSVSRGGADRPLPGLDYGR